MDKVRLVLTENQEQLVTLHVPCLVLFSEFLYIPSWPGIFDLPEYRKISKVLPSSFLDFSAVLFSVGLFWLWLYGLDTQLSLFVMHI